MEKPALVWSTNQPLLEKLQRNMLPQTLAKKRHRLLSQAKQRRRERSVLPMRLTSCIFKRPVTKITSHPGNKVWRRQWEETWEKPQQICAYRRLQGLQACSSKGDILSTFDVKNTTPIIASRSAGESPGHIGPGSLHTSAKPTPAQFVNLAEMIPEAGLCGPQPFCRQLVTRGDIRKQTLKVKKARERLAMALTADRLAREAERARSQDDGCEN